VDCSSELRQSLHWLTDALEVRDFVKTPATEDAFSNSINSKSCSLLGDFLIPEKQVDIFKF
jgi:hypothetical protein